MSSAPSRTLLLAAVSACLATASQAATLGIVPGPVAVTGTGESFYVAGSDLTFAGSTNAGADIAIAVALDSFGGLAAGVGPGVLLVGDALSGTVDAFGFMIDPGTDGGDVIEIGFVPTGGALAAGLGDRALAILTGEFGTSDDFAASSFFSPTTVAISPVPDATPVPLPASGLLLTAGIGLIALRRRVTTDGLGRSESSRSASAVRAKASVLRHRTPASCREPE